MSTHTDFKVKNGLVVNTTATFLTTVTSTGTASGGIIISGGVGIAKDVWIGGTLNIVNTASATSTITGALVVTGGAGIGGSMYVGGNITVAGTINASITGVSTTATNIAGGTAGQLHYQSAPGVTAFAGPGTAGQLLVSAGTSAPVYTNTSSIYVGNATKVDTVLQTSTASYYPTFVSTNNASAAAMSVYTTSSFIINPSTGNVGIGTSSPGARLQITVNDSSTYTSTLMAATTSDALIITNDDQTTTGYTGLLIYHKSSGVAMGRIAMYGNFFGSPNAALTFGLRPNSGGAGTVERMRIVDTGQVAIGTTTTVGLFNVAGDTFITGINTLTNTTVATSTTTGALQVAGGVGVGGSMYVGGGLSVSGINTLINTTVSASTTTGALQVSGGVGIGGNLNVGGTVVGGGVRTTSTNGVAPANPTTGDIWYDTSTDTTYRYTYDGTSYYWVDNVGPILSSASTIFNRVTSSTTTSALAYSSSTNLIANGYKSYILSKVIVDTACWLRIYTDADAQTADASRSIGTDPVAGSGIVAEIISAGALTQRITPCVLGVNLDSPPTTNLYLTVTNLQVATTQINISMNLIQLES